MELKRDYSNNYGTIKKAFIGLAIDYDALIAANGGSSVGFPQNVIDQYLYIVEFDLEKGTWSENSQDSSNGESFQYDIFLKFRKMNQTVRAWRSQWVGKQVMVLVYDFQDNEILFGSKNEPYIFTGRKSQEQRVTDGSFYDVKISGEQRSPL